MPTKAELINLPGGIKSALSNFHEPSHSWTDDLPVCTLSAVGFSTNQKYKVDGTRWEEHAFEDRCFHFRYDENTYFYGIFDGHVGIKAADFAMQRMPAEILLGQLKGKEKDEEIKEVLQQAFLGVEKGFFESIDDLLAEKENLRLQLQGLRTIEALKQYPEVVERLKNVTEEIQSGTTALVALLLKNKLYLANVGDSRALLCKEDKDMKTSAIQLSPDHTFSNEDELLRLSQLGIDIEKVRNQQKSGLQNCTRCIGNYTLKGGYKEFDNLSEAQDEPIIAEPDIVGGINIDEKCKFLLLMSDGLYKSLEEATGTSNVNAVLVNMVLEQFLEQSTLNGVAQAVVDKVVRIHHDTFLRDAQSPKCCQKRDDITLLIRNFNCSLPKTRSNSICSQRQTAYVDDAKAGDKNISEHNTLSDIQSIDSYWAKSELNNKDNSIFLNEPTSLTSTSESAGPQVLFQSGSDMSLDEDGKIKPYVDFTDFYNSIADAFKEGLVPENWLQSD